MLPYLIANGGASGSGLDISSLTVSVDSTISGKLNITATGATSATSYKYRYALQSGNINTAIDATSSSSTFSITGLTPGQIYQVMVRAYNGATFGDAIIKQTVQIPIITPVATIQTATSPDVTGESPIGLWFSQGKSSEEIFGPNGLLSKWSQGLLNNNTNNESSNSTSDSGMPNQLISPALSSTRSLFSISNNVQDKARFNVAYKQFTEIPTNEAYYSFGTTVLLDSTEYVPNQSGGIGFFVSNLGTTGYFLRIQASAAGYSSTRQNDISVFKLKDGDLISIPDSQKTDITTLAGVNAGQAYKVDVKIKVTDGVKNEMTFYVNGFQITAIDSTNPLPITNTVAMYSGSGTLNFDYIYGMSISEKEYSSSTLYNTYSGQFSDSHMEFLFGDKFFDNTILANPIKGRTEEFGTVGRELKTFQFKFPDRPAFPIAPTTGISSNIKIMGSKLTNFGAEAYVLNNSGFSVALSDDTEATFMVYGYSISKSGELQYDNFDKNLYTSEKPVIFNTRWLQNESDVKRLADWLKTQWAKKQALIELNVFGNPLLQVGDVITIDYPYYNITTSQKFLVLSVNNNYNGGLDTSITCRTIS
jgi:hypothetical protein